jgi:hypothetical protein
MPQPYTTLQPFFWPPLSDDAVLAIREVLFRLTDQFETRYASQIRDAERDENRPHDHQPDLFDGPGFRRSPVVLSPVTALDPPRAAGPHPGRARPGERFADPHHAT